MDSEMKEIPMSDAGKEPHGYVDRSSLDQGYTPGGPLMDVGSDPL